MKSYLESKLLLYSNLQTHFEKIPGLKEILLAYQSSFERSDDPEKLKRDIKARLISAGVYKNEELLEFLLLVSEKERSFSDRPNTDSDESLGEYFFGKYATAENWSWIDFNFFLQHNHSFQTERIRVIEEVVMTMIARSRAHLEKTLKPMPEEIARTIYDINFHFQEVFLSYFGSSSPISLVEVTNVTREYTEHADRILGKTFIDIQSYYRNYEMFTHLVIHEGMHLCFRGFKEKFLEEGLLEYFIERLFENGLSESYAYAPVNETYQEWKDNFKIFFQALPDAEERFSNYFMTQDVDSLRRFLRENLTSEVEESVAEGHRNRMTDSFIIELKKFMV